MRKIREVAVVTAVAMLMTACPFNFNIGRSGAQGSHDMYGGMYTAYAADKKATQSDAEREKNGWYVENGKRFYYINNEKQKNKLIELKEVKNGKQYKNIYYVGDDGALSSGLKRIKGNLYYFDKESKTFPGAAITGWKTVKGYKYYFLSSKKAATGLTKIGSKKYYFNQRNVLLRGRRKVGSNYMYFSTKTGAAVTGQIVDNIYFDSNGYALRSKFFIHNGRRYYAASNYRVKKGLFYVAGNRYYAGSNGVLVKNTFKTVNKKTYYFGSNYKALKGVKRVGRYYYYFDNKNVMKKNVWYQSKYGRRYFGSNGRGYIGLHRIRGYVFYFNNNGRIVKNTWQTVKGNKYYLSKSGKAYTGLRKIGKSYYYFATSGKMVKNRFITYSGRRYYFGADGKAYTGVRRIKNDTYYFTSKGYMTGTIKKINGRLYIFDENGRQVDKKGWYDSKNGNRYYVSEKGDLLTGYRIIDGDIYYFSKNKGYMYRNGWAYANGYKFYFGNDGKRLIDVDSVLGHQDSYEIAVNKTTNVVTVYAKDGDKGYIIPVKAFVCSGGESTPVGTFYTPAKGRWWVLMGPCYGQWDTLITGDILFHSVYYGEQDPTTLSVSAYNQLGTTCSHGCIRLKAGDAKWIYDNCELGTKVTIFESESDGPFPKPSSVQLDYSHSWDPTDPTMAYKCKELGCHKGIAW